MNHSGNILKSLLASGALLAFCVLPATAQNTISVTGCVTGGSEKEILIGAAVKCPQTGRTVITNLDGIYTISVPDDAGATLTASYVGMKDVTVAVKGRRTVDIAMTDDNTLESAVIVGAYGTVQRREDLTGSAFQINSEALQNKPVTRVDNMLEGMIPGMTIEANTDAAGTTRTRYETRIRGAGSLSGSSEPLWIIDGIPQYTGDATNQMPGMSYTVSPLSYINPDDIESITVLKDADQVSIYGANGANGVILVTTKSGARDNALTISVSARYGVATVDRSTMFKVMNAAQYMEVAGEAWVNSGKAMEDFPYRDNEYNSYSTTDTYWPDIYLDTGNEASANLSLSYGGRKTGGRTSLSYYNRNNTVKTDRQQRFTLSTKNDFALLDNLHLGISLSASYNHNKLFPLSSSSYLEVPPVFSPWLEDGKTLRLYNNVWSDTEHRFEMKQFYYNYVPDRTYNDNYQRTLVTDGSANLSWKIINGLQLRSTLGAKMNYGHEDIYYAKSTIRGWNSGKPVGSSGRKDVSYLTWDNNNVLEFNRNFGKFHPSAIIGIEFNSQTNRYSYISGSGFMNDHIKEIEYAETISSGSYSNIKNTRNLSYFGRAELSYDSRYIVSGNFRRDGSSIFGKYSRWGTFWSAGLSWNIHKERFYDVPWLKVLKLKATYGKTGSSKIDATTASGTYTYSDSAAYMGKAGGIISTVPNPGLSWETTYQFNTGIRTGFTCGLDLEVEFYDYLTKDLLNKMYVSRTITEDRVYANVGKVRNRGIELSVDYDVLHSADWNWNVKLNAAHNRNRIIELYNDVPTSFGSTVWMVGYSSNTYMLIPWAGVDPLDGSPLWYDKEGNLTKTYDYDNRVPGKSSDADLTGGISTSLRWKNFTLSLQMNYTIGGWAYPTYGLRMMNDGYDIIGSNQAVEVYSYRWKKPGDLASFPKVSNASQHSLSYTDRLLMPRTNFNLSNITLSYRLPDKALRAMRMKSADVAFICDNAFLFCPGMSREFNSFKTMKSGYPSTRTFTLSLNLSF